MSAWLSHKKYKIFVVVVVVVVLFFVAVRSEFD